MNLEIDSYLIKVTLSRRNLLALLAKLDGQPYESMCTIYTETPYGKLSVKAQEDAIHYKDRPLPPGEMHPDTETQIKQ